MISSIADACGQTADRNPSGVNHMLQSTDITITRGNRAKLTRELRRAVEAARRAYDFCPGSYSNAAHSSLLSVIAAWEAATGADVGLAP